MQSREQQKMLFDAYLWMNQWTLEFGRLVDQ